MSIRCSDLRLLRDNMNNADPQGSALCFLHREGLGVHDFGAGLLFLLG